MGWGRSITRDDLSVGSSGPADRFSRSGTAFFRHPFAPILTAATVCLATVLTVRFLTGGPTVISTLWLSSGLAIVVWLRAGRGLAYDLTFGGMTAFALMTGELLLGNPPDRAVIFMALSLLETVLSVLLLRRFLPNLDVRTVKAQVRLALCIFVGTLPSAVLCIFLLRHGALDGPLAGMRMWWMGHGLGSLLVAAAGLPMRRSTLTILRSPKKLIEFLVLLSILIVAATMVLAQRQQPWGFAILPIMLVIAVRMGVIGSALSLCVLAVIAIKGSVAGYGPYYTMELSHRLAMVQMLMVFGYAPALMVAALLNERDTLAERARIGRIKAEQSSVAKSRLLANVAHEIKSPIGGVIGIAEMWAAGHLGKVEPAQVEMAQMLVRTGRQIEALSHDLLDVAQAESGAVRIELRPTDVHGAMQDAMNALKLLPEASGLKIEVVEEERGLMVLADSQRLAQILGNLGSNAAKYGRMGGFVRFRIARANAEMIRLYVEDGGQGLSPEKQAQLFEPFNRLGLERSTIEGHGIGLALSKRLAELQNGHMGVTSVQGQGASFWIELPEAL